MLLRAVLGASVVLNLVLGGVLLVGQPAPPPAPPRSGFERMLVRLETALPEADRAAFRRVMQEERAHYQAQLEASRAARRAVDAALARNPFDPQALRDANAAWAQRWAEFSEAFGETMVHAMAVVSAEGRAQIAAARGRDR